MINAELYEKTRRVFRSCNNRKQFDVAERYYKLAVKQLPKAWAKDLKLHYVNTRQRIRRM